MATDDADRIEQLETEVDDLRETVEQQRYTLRYLAAALDIDAIEATCPHCNDGTFRKRSGISWDKLLCDNCGHEEYI